MHACAISCARCTTDLCNVYLTAHCWDGLFGVHDPGKGQDDWSRLWFSTIHTMSACPHCLHETHSRNTASSDVVGIAMCSAMDMHLHCTAACVALFRQVLHHSSSNTSTQRQCTFKCNTAKWGMLATGCNPDRSSSTAATISDRAGLHIVSA